MAVRLALEICVVFVTGSDWSVGDIANLFDVWYRSDGSSVLEGSCGLLQHCPL
jgi:hypothetical protein